MNPPAELLDRVARLLGSRPVEWRRAMGGYSIAERWTMHLSNGLKVFAKMAPNEGIATFLRAEHRVMTSFDDDFRCEVVAWEDGDRPLLVLEDLSHAYWPPPWERGQFDHALTTLDRVWSMPAAHLPTAANFPFRFWDEVIAEPAGFLSLGIASADWLGTCSAALTDAAKGANLEGTDFLHMDIRSDNMCFDGDRVVLVDWNWAARGPRDLDLAFSLAPLRLEGGPLPDEVKTGLGHYAALASGFFATQAPLPAPEGAPTVRRFQLRQLRVALPWACREIGLPMPDVAYARIVVAQIDRDLDAGLITEQEWHERTEEVLIDAYLASDDPRAQSGKGGDEATWRWARELVLDVFPLGTSQGHASFLDVGCANDYLMESVVRWGAGRGIVIEPYGLDISWRIAALARHRLPQWADRIFVGNVIDWTPPRRFDVVQAGLDEVPPSRRRELVEWIVDRYLVSGGKLVFRANRVREGEPDIVAELHALGFVPDGVIESTHPTEGVRRTAWLSAPLP